MTSTRVLTLTAAAGAGLAAGVFFAFSTFVMAGLRKAPADAGLRAMQAINKAAPTPLFMLVLFGTAALALVLGVRAARDLAAPGAAYRLAAALVYLAGIVVTIAYHVPRNDALASLDPAAAPSVADWHDWAAAWTAWNHVRTATSLAAAVLFTLAARAA